MIHRVKYAATAITAATYVATKVSNFIECPVKEEPCLLHVATVFCRARHAQVRVNPVDLDPT